MISYNEKMIHAEFLGEKTKKKEMGLLLSSLFPKWVFAYVLIFDRG